MRRRIIGNVDAEQVNKNLSTSPPQLPNLVKDCNDFARRRVAPCRPTNNGVHRQNAHLDFGPDTNDPSTGFERIMRGYDSLDALTHAITQSIVTPPQIRPPPQQLGDVLREYSQATQLLENATTNHARSFYSGTLIVLTVEMEQIKARIENDSSRSSGGYTIE
eukprot:CCRYP_020181-RA/>CCRYP_020181-RA protein AED:0.61 eAED:0.40 QI:0/-1/0/1/-1/1/1/0/162